MSKIYLITGASSTIGLNLIRAIYNETDVFIAHYNKNSKELIRLTQELGENIHLIKADFTNEADVDRFIADINEQYKKVTHIVHLPAMNIEYKKFQKIKWEKFQDEINVELRSIVKILNQFMGTMVKDKEGKIVFLLSSGVVNVPPKYLSSYITSKYALLGFMKALAAEYAEKYICINAVAPSMINTPFLKDVPDIVIRASASNNPMKRNAKVEDIIPMIKILLSDENKFMTGNCICVSGGEVF